MNSNFENISEELRKKWQEVPGTRQGRVFSSEVLKWTDDDILEYWGKCKKKLLLLK
ncbi:hypothetical protein [Clostridium sp. OS1-26]|uniref:hypothetical protein n=1 Tax=Clostridium sp. OS1-26 TaxID=3070681 RepID=UPI0027DF7957|nr:hypothetical protein [Clostridium sp. OS1-26]WML35476.1 hypothetical protein RCG18_01590 [Clostridium sp. OS1-26]